MRVLLVGLVACTNVEPSLTLEEMPELELLIVTGPNLVSVDVLYNEVTAGCVRASETLRATLNGVPLLVDHGGDHGGTCDAPTLRLAVPDPPETATLVVEDESRTITTELGDLLVPRTLAPVGTDTWTFAPGQTVTLRWSPASDLEAHAPSVTFEPEPFEWIDLPAVRNADTITFTLPNDLTLFGVARLLVAMEGTGGIPLHPCTNARCRIVQSKHLDREILVDYP